MSYVVKQRSMVAAQEITSVYPDPTYISFVAKAQKTKTRKGKDYFVLRVTIPKESAEQIGAAPDDFLLFRAKKALWYHMIDWNEMEPTWKMLPPQTRIDVIVAGLPNPDTKSLATPTSAQGGWTVSDYTNSNGLLTSQVTSGTASGIAAGGK